MRERVNDDRTFIFISTPLKCSISAVLLTLHGLWFQFSLRLCVTQMITHLEQDRFSFQPRESPDLNPSLMDPKSHATSSSSLLQLDTIMVGCECVCVLYIRVFCVCRLVYVHQMLQQRTLSKTPLVTKGPDTL